jgi:uncharacterized protein (DUF1330 family)
LEYYRTAIPFAMQTVSGCVRHRWFQGAPPAAYFESRAYSRRSAKEVAAHGGRIVALGKFRESLRGDITPRKVLIVVEWESRDAFQGYLDDPALADLHPHREKGGGNYIWHLFDRIDDLRPLFNLKR